jgi:hypothetical protein
MAQYAFTFTSGDTVTPTKLNNARTVSEIVDADIKSDAAIAGTKIAPDFGSQNVVTTGDIDVVSDGAALISCNTANDATTSDLRFFRSRGTQASKTALEAQNRALGRIRFFGYDGANFVEGALITAATDGAPGTNSMPVRLVFSTTADNASSPTEKMRITASGLIIAAGETSATAIAGSFVTSGRIQSGGTYSNTTATAANVAVLSNGLLARSTSSARYKKDVETANDSFSAAAVLGVRPVWFRSTSEEDRSDWSHWGFIAEEVAEIDPRLVQWGPDENGGLRPEGVQYDRFVPHLCAMIQKQQAQIAGLSAKVAALEAA